MSQVSRVVSLAHCSLGKPKDKESALDEVLENWKDLEDSSYPLKEDYALKRVSGDKDNYRVFNCGDIEKFIKTQDDADKYGKYRKPSHINRTYNATLVCPICYLQDSRIILNGFICADTTSSYSEWDKHNSYEEELISFASSTISSLVHNNIREYEKTLNAIDKIKKL